MKALKIAVAAAALSPVLALAEQEVVVTSNNVSGDAYSSPLNTFIPINSNLGFGYNNIRANSVNGINGTYARSGNGSAYLSLQDASGKADVEYYNPSPAGAGFANLGRLADLTTFGYDWYKDSVSGDNSFAPALRLFVDVDGNMSTSNDRGLVIYEPIYTAQVNGTANYIAPEGAWQTVTNSPTSGQYWIRFAGQNQFQGENGPIATGQTLAQLTDSSRTDLIAAINNGNATVYGFNFGIGSGWGTNFQGAVDNVRLGFGTNEVVRYNFEQPVPEPASIAALGLGAVALIRRRRKQS